MKWLKTQKGFKLEKWLLNSACEGGNMEIIRWFRSEGCPWDEWTCEVAAMNGHLDVLQWAIDNDCPYENSDYTRRALKTLGLA